jgi:hypothetical protein
VLIRIPVKPGTRLVGKGFDRVKHGARLSAKGISMLGEDRAVVGEPLHRMRRSDRAEALLDGTDHHENASAVGGTHAPVCGS